MRRVIKVELRPNKRQQSYLQGCCWLARVAYNWGLDDRLRRYDTCKGAERFTTHFQQCQEWIAHRDAAAQWACEYPATIVTNALKNLDLAFAAFYRRLRTGGPAGFPRFKKPQFSGSFQVSSGDVRPVSPEAIRIPLGRKARLPRRLAIIRTKERLELPSHAVWKTACIRRTATGRWYAAMLYEVPEVEPPGERSSRPLAVYLGLRHFAVLGDERGIEHVEAPEWVTAAKRRLARADRRLARRRSGSHGREAARLQRAKLREHLAAQRRDFIEVFTTRLVRRGRPLVIQRLEVQEMYSIPHLARRMVDHPWYEIRRQLERKAAAAGVRLIVVASSTIVTQRCSRCGQVRDEATKLQQLFTCPSCGLTMCAEENACRNLLWAGTASTAETHAGGADPAPKDRFLGEGLALKPEGSSLP